MRLVARYAVQKLSSSFLADIEGERSAILRELRRPPSVGRSAYDREYDDFDFPNRDTRYDVEDMMVRRHSYNDHIDALGKIIRMERKFTPGAPDAYATLEQLREAQDSLREADQDYRVGYHQTGDGIRRDLDIDPEEFGRIRAGMGRLDDDEQARHWSSIQPSKAHSLEMRHAQAVQARAVPSGVATGILAGMVAAPSLAHLGSLVGNSPRTRAIGKGIGAGLGAGLGLLAGHVDYRSTVNKAAQIRETADRDRQERETRNYRLASMLRDRSGAADLAAAPGKILRVDREPDHDIDMIMGHRMLPGRRFLFDNQNGLLSTVDAIRLRED
jgi:hypothetical protein